MPQIQDANGNLIPGVFSGFGRGQSVAYTGTAGSIAGGVFTPQGSVLGLVVPNDGDTVTIGTIVYTFKTALTPTAGEVLIGANLLAATLNLIRAINHSGTAGTDYANSGSTAVVNPDVSADIATTGIGNFQVYSRVAAPTAAQLVLAASAPTRVNVGASISGSVGNAPQLVRVMTSTAAFVRIAQPVSNAAVAAVVTDYPMGAGIPQVFPITPGDRISAIQSAANGTLNVIEVY